MKAKLVRAKNTPLGFQAAGVTEAWQYPASPLLISFLSSSSSVMQNSTHCPSLVDILLK